MMTPPNSPRRGPDCRRFESLIGLSNRGDLTHAEQDALQTHLAECPWCQAQQAADQALVAAMRRTFTVRPAGRPLFTAEGIMAMATQPPIKTATRPSTNTHGAWWAAIGAALIIVLLTVAVFHALRPLPAQKPRLTPAPSPSANAATQSCAYVLNGESVGSIGYGSGHWLVATGPDEAWAIVDIFNKFGGSQGAVMHYTGGSWSQVLLPFTVQHDAQMIAISADNTRSVWVVAQANFRGYLLRYVAGQWITEPQPDFTDQVDSLGAISMISPTDGWGMWDGSIAHFDGVGWSKVFSATDLLGPHNAYDTLGINDLEMISDHEGWAVGDSGFVLHYDGSTWKEMADPGTDILYSVSFGAPDDGWAVGDGTGFMHYQHGSWSYTNTPIATAHPEPQAQVAMDSASDGWAGGVNLLLHYHQGSWTREPAPISGWFQISSMVMGSADSGWALTVNNHATFLRYSAGAWRIDSPPPSICMQ